jgi:hypothetical protein
MFGGVVIPLPTKNPTFSPALTVATLGFDHPSVALRPQRRSVESGNVLGYARAVSASVAVAV